LSFCKES